MFEPEIWGWSTFRWIFYHEKFLMTIFDIYFVIFSGWHRFYRPWTLSHEYVPMQKIENMLNEKLLYDKMSFFVFLIAFFLSVWFFSDEENTRENMKLQ